MSSASPSAQCHPNKALYALTMCRNCYERDLKRRNPEYARRQRDNQRRWAEAHPERITAIQEKRRSDPVARDRDQKTRRRALLRQYGLSEREYQTMYDQQGGACAICTRAAPLQIDHCHATGRVRGLLCFRCNLGIAKHFDEDAARLHRAGAYLERSTW